MTDERNREMYVFEGKGAGSMCPKRRETALNKEQFRAEKLYRMSLSVAKTMLEKDIISKDEFAEIDTMLLEKYRPVLGTLLAGKPFQQFPLNRTENNRGF